MIEHLLRENIRRLKPYSTARDDFSGDGISVWLDANESPYNHSLADLSEVSLNRYPDPHQRRLKAHLARLKGVRPEQMFIGGAGSDEAIDLVYRMFCEPGRENVVAISPTYGVYAVAADINNVEYREVSLTEDFQINVDALLNACDSSTKLVWICSPNNPTSNAFPREVIEDILQKFSGIVVVDEAYIDFSDQGSMLPLLDRYPRLIVMQTLSKAWGMASLRLGMAFASEEIAAVMAMVKYPYNVNGPTQAVVERLTSNSRGEQIAEIISERRRLEEELPKMPCVVKVCPSDANFLLVKMTDANGIYDYLLRHGALVRNRTKVRGCNGCLRITVGTPEENTRLLSLLANL